MTQLLKVSFPVAVVLRTVNATYACWKSHDTSAFPVALPENAVALPKRA
jgi:hypothetical protein